MKEVIHRTDNFNLIAFDWQQNCSIHLFFAPSFLHDCLYVAKRSDIAYTLYCFCNL